MHDRCLMIHSFAHGGIKYRLAGQGIRLEDFRAYKPQHTFIYTPTREPWPAISVNNTSHLFRCWMLPATQFSTPKGNQKRFPPASGWIDIARSNR